MIFGNSDKAVSFEEIENLQHSLLLIKVKEFEVCKKVNQEKPGNIELRLNFNHNNCNYDFPITDPSFIHHYKVNPDFFKDKYEAFLCLSLGISWKDWFYKLVAGIIF